MQQSYGLEKHEKERKSEDPDKSQMRQGDDQCSRLAIPVGYFPARIQRTDGSKHYNQEFDYFKRRINRVVYPSNYRRQIENSSR